MKKEKIHDAGKNNQQGQYKKTVIAFEKLKKSIQWNKKKKIVKMILLLIISIQ